MKKEKRKKRTSKLAILLTLIIFVLLLLGNILTFFLIAFLYFQGHFPPAMGQSFVGFLFYLLLLSTLVGTVLSLMLGYIPLSPLNRLFNAMSEVANGNLDVRLNPTGHGEFQHIAENFNAMTEALNANEILRSDFINNFSHEFKTPIVSIRGFAKILKDNNLTPEEQSEYLDIIISESTRLSALANNVLNLSKIESHNMLTNVTIFNITEQIRKCILMLETHWEQKDIELEIDMIETDFKGNEEMMTQIWINLLDNAIKFTPTHGRIRIRLTKGVDNLIFSIADNGCGIPADKVDHIYDKFYQCDTSHSSAGNGLGLCVVKKVVALHNGNIVVNSIPNQGTTFTILLPLAEEI